MIINVAPLLKQSVSTQLDISLHEDPIDPHGENAGLLDAGAVMIDAELHATHTDPGVYVEGSADAFIEQQCSRCLRPTRTPVSTTFAEQYYVTAPVMSGEEVEEAPEFAKVIEDDFLLDLTPLLREELILATPQVSLHSPECKGLCQVCGEDLNDHPHTHNEAIDERWSKLAQLRDFHAERE
ncbi:MAG: DUF177 domain-containing protein [Chloroflexi bacterium]|nr:DUF177 domain-containing protein [Chloroflexota bacterium]